MRDDDAMRDLLKNYKSNFSTLDSEKKKKTTFKMQFKSKKRDESETIVIHNKHRRKKGEIIHTSNFFWEGTAARKGAEPLPETSTLIVT